MPNLVDPLQATVQAIGQRSSTLRALQRRPSAV